MPLLLTLFLCSLALAQVEHLGRLALADDLFSWSSKNTIHLPPLSNSELMVAAAASDAVSPGPSRFGEAVEMHADLHDGEWFEDKDRGIRQWRLQISSPGAITLSLLFDDFFLPEDGELYVIGLNVSNSLNKLLRRQKERFLPKTTMTMASLQWPRFEVTC